jgi:hypothetical protein
MLDWANELQRERDTLLPNLTPPGHCTPAIEVVQPSDRFPRARSAVVVSVHRATS